MSGNRVTQLLAVALIVPLALTSSACNYLEMAPMAAATTTVGETFQVNQPPKIVVETFNGSIDISDDGDKEVVVEVTKRASRIDQEAAEAALNEIEVSLVQKDNTIHVQARPIRPHLGNLSAAVVITAPKGSRLQLKTSNGHIVCEGMGGGIDAGTSNGKIDVVQATGAIEATTSNGAIDIEAHDAVVDARTSNGRIQFAGTLAAHDQQFRSSNGAIQLTLPPDSQFKLEASTSNSGVSCDFPLTTEGKNRRNRLKGTVGEHPAASISAATSNGAIRVRKAGGDE